MRLTLLALAAAAVGGGVSSTSAIQHGHHHAASRTSINYGPLSQRRISAHHANDAGITAFNHKYAFPESNLVTLVSLSGRATGLTIADAFLDHLHPAQAFRLHSTTLSASDTVLHAHYVSCVLPRTWLGWIDCASRLATITPLSMSGYHA